MRAVHFAVAMLPWLIACRGSPSRGNSMEAAASAAASAPTLAPPDQVASSVIAESRPSDLELPELSRVLGCGTNPSRKPCSVLNEFARADHFRGETPSSESRWLGRAYRVENGVEREEFLLLYWHKVPTAKVRPGSLPIMVSTSELPIEVRVEAKRMWTSLSHGRHRANRRNLAFRFIEQYEPKVERGLIETSGISVRTLGELSEDSAYLRQPSLKRLLWLQPSKQMNSRAGDGTYAEFWQATW